MTTAAERRLRASERRQLIEQAATELFARHGYASTSVEDIVAAAGVTKPMLYRHFESKRDLCVALLERYRDELIAAPLSLFDPEADDMQSQLISMIEAWLDHAFRHPDSTRLLFTPITGDPEVAETQRELHARQRATQAALLREFAPSLDQAEAETMGELSRAAFAAVALWSIEHPDVRRQVPARALLKMVQGLISTADDGSRG